uniref:PsbP C-terminal domain-containing protein n=1 Tax=Oryza nivara TaxID=4536 RepID=A0A0E0HZ37_ORYNI
MSVEISSPSSSKYVTVEDLGPPEKAAERVLQHYLTEFMSTSTKLGVRRTRNLLSTMLSTSTFILFGPKQITLAETTGGSTLTHDGYSFLYPNSWIQVRGAGADLFRDPFVLDENMSVEISSPSSSKYVTVEDLGPPEKAAERVLQHYLTEFMLSQPEFSFQDL